MGGASRGTVDGDLRAPLAKNPAESRVPPRPGRQLGAALLL